MSTIEAVLPWISSLDLGPLSRVSSTGALARPARPARVDQPASACSRVGTCSLRQIVDDAVAHAEGEVIRRALATTLGNKSQAARLLRTNYTTLHAKMKRYGISAREFQS
ncbi:MAG TPA: helix-turn-helix domain-containing protein [Methylomirabilota bacterium]|jgi:two-component system nitrogen regulation response regulator GlnG